MKPFTRISRKALIGVGTGALALSVLGAFGISPLQAATSTPAQAATAPFAGPPAWAGGGGYGAALGPAVAQQAITALLGISADELRAERLTGKSLVAIAQARGISSEKLVSTIVTAHRAQLTLQVKNGLITQAQADQIAQTLTARVTTMVQQSGPQMGAGMRGQGRQGLGAGHGMWGRGRAAAPVTTPPPTT